MFLFPVPYEIHDSQERFDYSGRSVIAFQNPSPELRKALLRIAAAARGRGLSRLSLDAGRVPDDCRLVEIVRADALGPEEFTLDTTAKGALIRAGGNPGAVYALQTFLRLMAENPAAVPGVKIHDKPSLPHRGYMLDISRCKVPTMDSLKRLVDILADLRCNELQLYTEHTFAFRGHEAVWKDASPMTPEEILELDAYCRERFIELVPNFNSFGHMERWFCHPEYLRLAECPEPLYWEEWEISYQATLYPSDEALQFLEGLYAQMLPNFTSGVFNVGCDETIELGKGRSAERCRQEGTTQVYLDFLSKIVALAGKFGRKVQFWGDIILHSPELIGKLPPGVTAMKWGYEASHPFDRDCAKFAESGVPFHVCPGTSTWNTFIGRYPNMVGNISRACEIACQDGAEGMLLTDWGDCGHHQYWPVSWPGICFGMACAWNHRQAAEQAKRLPETVGAFFDPQAHGSALGEMLRELGELYLAFPPETCVNCTTWGSVFETRPDSRYGRKLLEKSELRTVEETLEKLRAIQTRLIDMPPTDDPLVCAELANGMLMTQCALEYMLWGKGQTLDTDAWRTRMDRLIVEHNRLWLARNRIGGLAESTGALCDFKARIKA